MNKTIIIYDFCFTPSLPIFPDAQKFTKSTNLEITSTMDTTLEAAVCAIITVSMLVATTDAQPRHHRFPDAV